MTNLERFKAVVRFERPDYVPIFGFPGAPGMSRGCMTHTHDRLRATGMPRHVGGRYESYVSRDVASWYRYWGTCGPISPGFGLARGAAGWRVNKRIEGEWEVVESETGALTRQVLDNDNTYSMPEFIRYDVRDRASWEFYRRRRTATAIMPREEMEALCKPLDDRTEPLCIDAWGGYGLIRGMMGPEAASFCFYDDPELVHEIVAWELEQFRRFTRPLIERLRPEIVSMGEDLCFNHGMLVSPEQFDTFFGGYYREVAQTALANGADLVAVDTDGNAMRFVEVARRYGINGVYPMEVKAGNDLFELRRRFPDFVLFGWLEKEAVNEGNEAMIEPEILGKVPRLLASGGYFPNGDHGIQPPATFRGLCRFMTLLHEVTGNPEGEFPRM